MTLLEAIAGIKTEVDNLERETKSLESGRKASASRARKSLQNIKTKAHGMRKDIMDFQKSLPTKPRVKAPPLEPEEVSDNTPEVSVAS
mgnify:CR=1 FL=1